MYILMCTLLEGHPKNANFLAIDMLGNNSQYKSETVRLPTRANNDSITSYAPLCLIMLHYASSCSTMT